MRDDIYSILSVSQRRNAAQGVTGALMCDTSWFLQCLEGDSADVAATYDRIQLDPRHWNATIIGTRDVMARTFPHWTMQLTVGNRATTAILKRVSTDGRFWPNRMTFDTALAVLAAASLATAAQPTAAA